MSKCSLKVGDSVSFFARKRLGKRFVVTGVVIRLEKAVYNGKKSMRAFVEVPRGGKYHKTMGKRVTSLLAHNLKPTK